MISAQEAIQISQSSVENAKRHLQIIETEIKNAAQKGMRQIWTEIPYLYDDKALHKIIHSDLVNHGYSVNMKTTTGNTLAIFIRW